MWFLSFIIHSVGIVFGFFICSLVIPLPKEINDIDEVPLEFEYVEELENLIDLKKEESPIIKTNITKLELPLLNNTVIMYYDPEINTFCYYTKGDIIYKYLNVVCRKYVIDHNCPSLYKEDTSHTSHTSHTTCETTKNNLFVKKIDRPTLDKDINKFILCGSLEDYNKIDIEIENDISILDYITFHRY